MKQVFIVGLFFSFFCLWLQGEEQYASESPHSIAIIDLGNKTDKKWTDFENELEWFLKNRYPATLLKDNIEDNYLKEKLKRENNAFVRSLSEANNTFFEYRNKVAEVLALNSGSGRYSESVYARVGFELTTGYIEFLEKKLFPENWRAQYDAYQKMKKEK